ncbi:hypothetical protein SpCBS45565_g02257 [Spizellomyces sp. 'palustris']|nr:hypothetical protein SpCBS45565_g02257 [Spizellomyces sp. 'palustris']
MPSPFYTNLITQLVSLLDPSLPLTSNLANTASLLYHAYPATRNINWVGFYLTGTHKAAKPDTLYLGPFHGQVACTVIPFSKGVCGKAAREESTVVVTDVHAFPGHIACDSASQSEIVVPVGVGGVLVGVLDVDCKDVGGFTEEDRVGLEEVVRVVCERGGW